MREKHSFWRWLAFGLAGLGLAGSAAGAQFRYVVTNGNVTLTRYTGTSKALVIPDTYAGRPVTEVGSFLAMNNGTITSLVVAGSVTNLGQFAFYGCSNLVRAATGDGVRTVGKSAFRYCSRLTHLEVGERVKLIGEYAFAGCTALRSVAGADRLYGIGKAAFMNCTSLRELAVPPSVRRIDGFAFYGCAGIGKVTIGDGVRLIGDSAFDQCRQLGTVVIGTGLARVGAQAFRVCPNLTGIYFFGNAPRFGANLHATAGARPFRLYYHRSATGWPRTVQGHRTQRFTRLPTLAVSPAAYKVDHLAGTRSFSVTNTGHGTLSYRVSETNRWMSIKQGRTGVNGGRFTVSFEINNGVQRTGLVAVTSTDATNSPQYVQIIQRARPILLVSPRGGASVPHLAGTTSFVITNDEPGTRMTYSTTASNSWLSIRSGGSGTNGGVLEVAFTANNGSTIRTGLVVVTSPGARFATRGQLKIVQDARPSLAVSPGQRTVDHRGGELTFSVTNQRAGRNMAYTAAAGSEWLSIRSGGSGTNSGTVLVVASSNLLASARTGTVVVTAPGALNSPATVRVVQSGRPVLAVSPALATATSTAGTVSFTVTNQGGSGMVYTSAVVYSTAPWYVLRSATGTDSGTIYIDYEFSLPGQQIQLEVTSPGAENSPCTVTLQSPAGRRKEPARDGKKTAMFTTSGAEPVAVATSDDVAPVYESGWAAVDGDLETEWEGQAAGGGFIAVQYEPAVELRTLDVELGRESLSGIEYLYSADGEDWQPLPEDLDAHPVVLNYLWLVFPDDGTEAVPRVREIRPNSRDRE